MQYARDFRARARTVLSGHWGVAIGTSLIASILGASILNSQTFYFNVNKLREEANMSMPDSIFQLFIPVLLGSVFLGVFYSLLKFIIGGAVTLGYAQFYLDMVDRREVRLNTLFSHMGRIGSGLLMQLLRSVYTTLWSLLFVIPGIIASYSYSMTAYIMAEHPEYSANEAIGQSKEMMKGNKWRLFCLEFSFIGWSFLCLFTCGIGVLWLTPYIETARAAFYREVSHDMYGAPQTGLNGMPNNSGNDNMYNNIRNDNMYNTSYTGYSSSDSDGSGLNNSLQNETENQNMFFVSSNDRNNDQSNNDSEDDKNIF